MRTDAELALSAMTDYDFGDIVLHVNGRRARVLNHVSADPKRLFVQWLTPRWGGLEAPVYVAKHNVRIWHGEQ